MINKDEKKEPSEGEKFIEDFLKQMNLKFDSQKKISNLKNDRASYRKADFYLPKYNTYIEFQGVWNRSPEDKENYKAKSKVYAQNNIPCVYLYPENLGIIHHVFDHRFQETLKKFGLEKELCSYKIYKFLKSSTTNIVSLFIFINWLLLALLFPNATDAKAFLFIFGGIITYQIYRLSNLVQS